MRKMMVKVALAALVLTAAAFAESFNNAPVIDVQCSTKAKANPDAHARTCALACAKSGFGIVTQDGRFLKFDDSGNQKVTELLKGSSKKDHLRVNVDGAVNGDVLQVQSIQLM